MRWMNPVALIGLVTLALPMLIHLFSRRPTRVMPFPSLRFFAPSRILPTRRTRIADIALLLVRLAVLATAVAALAAPLLNRTRLNVTGSTAANAAVVLIDDTSAVTRDSTVARAHADRILQLTTPSRASVVLRTDAPYSALPGAVAWLATQPQPHRVIVMSDFRRAAMDSLDIAAIPANVSVQLERGYAA